MKPYVTLSILLISFLGCKNLNSQGMYTEKKTKGVFLLEVNVPNTYYSTGDDIEQSNLMVQYNSNDQGIISMYKNGVFLNYYSPDLQIKKNELLDRGIRFDSISLNKLKRILQNAIIDHSHFDDSKFLRIKDNMLYLKISGEISYINIGETLQMIPKTEGYQCCYWNTIEKIPTNFITGIKDLEVLEP